MEVLLAKAGVAVGLAVALHWSWRREWLLGRAGYGWIAWSGLAVKITLALLLLAVAGDDYLRSDPRQFYFPQFEAAVRGAIIYRDFPSSFSPLFPYWLGPTYVFGGVAGFVIALLVLEWLTYLLLLRLILPGNWDGRSWTLLALLFSPLSVSYVLIEGQEDFLLLGLFLLGLAAARRGPLLSGGVFGVGMLATKVLAVMAGPPLAMANGRHPLRFLAGAALAAVGFAVLWLWGLDVGSVLERGWVRFSSGNLWYLVSIIFGYEGWYKWTGYCLAAAVIGLGWYLRRGRVCDHDLYGAVLLYGLSWATLLLLGHYTLGSYYLAFFPLLFVLAQGESTRLVPFFLWMQVPIALHNGVWVRFEDIARSAGQQANLIIQGIEAAFLAGAAVFLGLWCWSRLRSSETMLPLNVPGRALPRN